MTVCVCLHVCLCMCVDVSVSVSRCKYTYARVYVGAFISVSFVSRAVHFAALNVKMLGRNCGEEVVILRSRDELALGNT